MEATDVKHKHVRKIKDTSRFDIDNLQEYCLSILIGTHDLQLCVTDTRKNRVLLLEDFILQGADSPESHLAAIQGVYESHHLLNAAFWQEIKVGFKNRQFSLAPTTLFEESQKELYLQMNAEFAADTEQALVYHHHKGDISTVYAAPNYLVSYLKEKYPNGNLKLYHHCNSILEGLLKYQAPPREKVAYLFIDRFFLHLAVTKEDSLLYFNTFPIRKSDDYVNNLVRVMQAQDMNIKTGKVALLGFIRPQSKHYEFLHKYIPNLGFGHRNKGLKLSYDFDEVGEHQYFDLLTLYLCA